jgi:predicted HAD superfamily Cof-like phosphohydrolase
MQEENLSPTNALVLALVARMAVKVEEFNTTVRRSSVPLIPVCLTADQANRARVAVQEELSELESACEAGDVLEAADAIIDMMFFGLGRLAEMGIPAYAIFEAVHVANMQKVPGDLTKRIGWGGTDAVKPEGWKPPDHSWLLNFSLADVDKARMFDELSPVFQDLTRLRAAKGADYNDVPGGRDAYFPFGHESYAHMLTTKHLRMMSLLNAMRRGDKQANYEGLVDTVKDLVNYGAFYAEAMIDGRLSETSLRKVEVAV